SAAAGAQTATAAVTVASAARESLPSLTCRAYLPRARTKPRSGSGGGRRPRPQPEQGLVERTEELAPVAVQERLDEGAAEGIADGSARAVRTERLEQRCTLLRRLPEEDRGAHRGCPRAVVATEERGERIPYLPRPERPVGEERELPAVERLGEPAVFVRERQALAEICGETPADRVETCRLTARLRGGDRQQRRDAKGPEVEPLEDDRARRDSPRGREAKRADGIGELACRVRRLRLLRSEVARQLDDEQPVDVPTEVRRHQPERLGPKRRHLAGDDRAQSNAAAELNRLSGRQADDGRDRGVRARGAEQRPLDLCVRGRECLVLPVETTAALRDRTQERQQDRPEERVVLARGETRMCAGEDRGRRLTAKVVDRVARVRQAAKCRSLLVEEAPDEGPVLVERRAVARRVLLERERQLRTALDRERRETESAQRLVEVRCPKRHAAQLRDRGAVSYLAIDWRRMGAPTTAEFLAAFVIAAASGTAVFFHAERNAIKHPSGWASAVFLFLAIALPLYLWHVRRVRRSRGGR